MKWNYELGEKCWVTLDDSRVEGYVVAILNLPQHPGPHYVIEIDDYYRASLIVRDALRMVPTKDATMGFTMGTVDKIKGEVCLKDQLS